MKPFKSWLLWDAAGTYAASIHQTRRWARQERMEHPYRDAKWRITRVNIRKAA